jgi:F-type H+-transporting ATPase subunit a
MASPTPIVFPIKIVTDLAIPVSLACRLFGNMLGGMIVMDLLYMALGNAAVGIPSILGLYFNVFHPLIQTFIFVTLSLTFINEAVE